MSKATYGDFMTRNPSSTTPQATVEALLDDVEAEIAQRATRRGKALSDLDQTVLVAVECEAAASRAPKDVDGVDLYGVASFSQTVGDHTWSYGYSGGGVSASLLDSQWKRLGLSGRVHGFAEPKSTVLGDA